jgi:hypothetical protein
MYGIYFTSNRFGVRRFIYLPRTSQKTENDPTIRLDDSDVECGSSRRETKDYRKVRKSKKRRK